MNSGYICQAVMLKEEKTQQPRDSHGWER